MADAANHPPDAQRDSLSTLLARYTADRDALIAAVHACETRIAGVAARFDAGPAIRAGEIDELRRLIAEVQSAQREAATQTRALGEQALSRADAALHRVEELTSAQQTQPQERPEPSAAGTSNREALHAALETYREQLLALAAQVDRIRADHGKDLDALRTASNRLTAEFASHNVRVEHLDRIAGAAQEAATELAARVHGLEAALAAVRVAVESKPPPPPETTAPVAAQPTRHTLVAVGVLLTILTAAVGLWRAGSVQRPAGQDRERLSPQSIEPSAVAPMAQPAPTLAARPADTAAKDVHAPPEAAEPHPPEAAQQEVAAAHTAEIAAVAAALHSWREAWEAKRLSEYLGYYGPAFVPQSPPDLAAWQLMKRRLFDQRGPISVQISTPNIFLLDDGATALVTFEQVYHSKGLSSHASKVMRWRRNGDRWTIDAETVVHEVAERRAR